MKMIYFSSLYRFDTGETICNPGDLIGSPGLLEVVPVEDQITGERSTGWVTEFGRGFILVKIDWANLS